MTASSSSPSPHDSLKQHLERHGSTLQLLPGNPPTLEPATAVQVAEALLVCQQAGVQVAPFSLDAKAGAGGVALDLSRLTTVREHLIEDLVITVETGLTFGEFRTIINGVGQDLSVRFPEDWRLADIVMLDLMALETGLKRGVKEVVLGLEVATADGQLTKCGGKVVKNVTGYDLNKFYVASQYALVVPTAVTLRLIAQPRQSRWWRVAMPSLASAHALSEQLLAAPSVTLSALEWLPLASAQALFPQDPELMALQAQGSNAWIGWIRSEGLTQLVDLFAPQLETALSIHEPLAFQAIEAPELSALPPGFDCELWLEAFLPYGQWPQGIESVAFSSKPDRVQVRPAASYISWQWQAEVLSSVSVEHWQTDIVALSERIQALGGHLRLMQAPEGLEILFSLVNLPKEPVVRGLNDQFKARWDPARTLASRRLPL